MGQFQADLGQLVIKDLRYSASEKSFNFLNFAKHAKPSNPLRHRVHSVTRLEATLCVSTVLDIIPMGWRFGSPIKCVLHCIRDVRP